MNVLYKQNSIQDFLDQIYMLDDYHTKLWLFYILKLMF
jgi:hypothetical protein